MTGTANNSVFISYRRDVGGILAMALYQNLTNRGVDAFYDIEALRAGEFDTVILRQIAARPYFVLVLTPGTLERCGRPGDWLRREMEQAVATQRMIVPVNTPGFDFDDFRKFLPGELGEKVRRYNGVEIAQRWFKYAVQQLVEEFLVPVDIPIIPVPLADQVVLERVRQQVQAAPAVSEEQLTAHEYFERAYKRSDNDLAGQIADYTEAIRLDPAYRDAYYNRGIARKGSGDLQGAASDKTEAIRLDPTAAERPEADKSDSPAGSAGPSAPAPAKAIANSPEAERNLREEQLHQPGQGGLASPVAPMDASDLLQSEGTLLSAASTGGLLPSEPEVTSSTRSTKTWSTAGASERWNPTARYFVAGMLGVAAGVLRLVGTVISDKTLDGGLADKPQWTSYIIPTALILVSLALISTRRFRSYVAAVFVGVALALSFSTFNRAVSPWVWPNWKGFEVGDYPYLLSVILLVAAVAIVLSVRCPAERTVLGETSSRLVFAAAVASLVVFGPYNNLYGLSNGTRPYGKAFPFMHSRLGWSIASILLLVLGVYGIQYVVRRSSNNGRKLALTLMLVVVLATVIVRFTYPVDLFDNLARSLPGVSLPNAPPTPYVIGLFVPLVGTLSILVVGFISQQSPSRYGAIMIGALAVGMELQRSASYAVYSIVILAIVALAMVTFGAIAPGPRNLGEASISGA